MLANWTSKKKSVWHIVGVQGMVTNENARHIQNHEKTDLEQNYDAK